MANGGIGAGFAQGANRTLTRRIQQQNADTQQQNVRGSQELARIQERRKTTVPLIKQLTARVAQTAPNSAERQQVLQGMQTALGSMVQIFSEDSVALGGEENVGALLMDEIINVPQAQQDPFTVAQGAGVFGGPAGEAPSLLASQPTTAQQNVGIAPGPTGLEFQTNERRIAEIETAGETGSDEHTRLLQRQQALTSAPSGAGLRDLTPGARTDAQKQATRQKTFINSLVQFDEFAKGLGISDFGGAGNLKDVANAIVGQFADDLPFESRAQFVQAAGTLREGALRSVSDDQKFNKEDREFISALFPDGGITETKARVRVKARVLLAFHVRKFNETQESQGLTDTGPINLTLQDLGDAVSSGLLSEIEGIRIATRFGFTVPDGSP